MRRQEFDRTHDFRTFKLKTIVTLKQTWQDIEVYATSYVYRYNIGTGKSFVNSVRYIIPNCTLSAANPLKSTLHTQFVYIRVDITARYSMARRPVVEYNPRRRSLHWPICQLGYSAAITRPSLSFSLDDRCVNLIIVLTRANRSCLWYYNMTLKLPTYILSHLPQLLRLFRFYFRF